MRHRPSGGLFLSLLIAAIPAAAQTGVWSNFSSMKEVRSVSRTGDTLWAATSGGLFGWEPLSNRFTRLTSAEGLRSIDLTAAGIDRHGRVWSGSGDGIVHVYSPADGTLRTILDIRNANQTAKRINAVVLHGDTALFCTEFGLSLFRADRFEFGDTYTRFGTIPPNVRVAALSAAIFDGRIWIALSDRQTINRIASASLATPNLLPPEAWTTTELLSPATVIRSLVVAGGSLYAGTSAGLFRWTGSDWALVPGTPAVGALTPAGTGVAYCNSDGAVVMVDQAGTITQIGTAVPSTPTSITTAADGSLIVGTVSQGLSTFSGSWSSHFPNGPNANAFSHLAVDPAGALWCASGHVFGQGIYRFDGTSWTSFTASGSALPTNDVYRVAVSCDGSIWASTWGKGVAEIPAGGVSFDTSTVYGTNVGMTGIPGDPSFVVTSNVVCDGKGNRWLSIFNAANKNVLAVRRADNSWVTLPVILSGVRLSFLTDNVVENSLAVDAFDNIWVVVRDPAYKGVLSLGNGGAIDSTAAVHLTAASGLPSDDVRTIVVDRDNDVWVGTNRGIAIILDPSNPRRAGGIAAYKPLNGLAINSIAVDALNQKWVGTTEGAVLLSPDGTQVIASYTVENTSGKLIDNNVRTIAVDPRTGTVYFGTASGLASLTTSASAPRAEFEELLVYPNPYYLPNSLPATVDGLVERSVLRILTVDGTLVRSLTTPGGRVGYWDGRDGDGNLVASGVYLIVAASEDGSRVGSGKIAVLRR